MHGACRGRVWAGASPRGRISHDSTLKCQAFWSTFPESFASVHSCPDELYGTTRRLLASAVAALDVAVTMGEPAVGAVDRGSTEADRNDLVDALAPWMRLACRWVDVWQRLIDGLATQPAVVFFAVDALADLSTSMAVGLARVGDHRTPRSNAAPLRDRQP